MPFRVSFLVLALFSVSPAFSADVSPTPSGTISEGKLDAKTVRDIRREFRRRLDEEREQLKKDQDRTADERRAQRKIRRKEWDKTEAEARRKFFAENEHGPERRAYVQDFLSRRKAFYALLKDEERAEKNERDIRWKAMEEDQKSRWTLVEDSLKKGVRPDARLLQAGG